MANNRMANSNHFKLGVFGSNCSSGLTFTTIPERWDSTWENNHELAIMLDDAGMDFILPVARWIGYGGVTDCHGSALETLTWAAGLLALTKRISVIATVHTAVNHPVVVAKQLATIDHIGRGRAGLNIVAGWNKPEYEALGLNLPDDHETRYGYAQEWFDLVLKLWTHDGAFDWNGKYFSLKGINSKPKPFCGVPSIVNAAGSEQGRSFATRNANYLLTPTVDLARSTHEVNKLKVQARDQGREVEVLTIASVVCRSTEKEAQDFVQHVAIANRDEAGIDNSMRLQFAHGKSFPPDVLASIRDRIAIGHGGYPLVGTPDQIAAKVEALQQAGFGGLAVSFVDYRKEFPYFRDTVLPILEERKLRIENG